MEWMVKKMDGAVSKLIKLGSFECKNLQTLAIELGGNNFFKDKCDLSDDSEEVLILRGCLIPLQLHIFCLLSRLSYLRFM